VSYPQQGGYGPPQGGGYGPQPPQGGGYGPPTQQGYGYPPPGPGGYGYGHYPPPRKNSTGLIVGIAAAVVVVVVAVVLVIVLTGDDSDGGNTAADKSTSGDSNLPNGIPGPNGGGSGGGDSGDSDSGDSDSGSSGSTSASGSPEALADIVVDVVENQDEDLIDQHSCTSSAAAQLKSELSQVAGMDVSATVEDVQETGDTAQASIQLSLDGQTEGFTVEMEKDGDAWCVSGI
jgi:hypothetical protein